jgi:hypothetical protein
MLEWGGFPQRLARLSRRPEVSTKPSSGQGHKRRDSGCRAVRPSCALKRRHLLQRSNVVCSGPPISSEGVDTKSLLIWMIWEKQQMIELVWGDRETAFNLGKVEIVALGKALAQGSQKTRRA